ncbi:MAG: DUF1269 domain-containing protein [Prosthecobacter sp.]|uniref:hypothetical protein n=1 Tax=Prosthecobacter sp. TaxID=1965333 RepID=UPI0025F8131C|nr:hypothetical protein [Prosthecobacter sp.]MCF7786914.1 DUF1269 domain-containing protein [Prosthecobacter sp.]
MKTDTPADALVVVSKSHDEAESCAREFKRSVCDMKQLAFVGCDHTTGVPVACCSKMMGRVKCWGALGAFWGGVWGWLFGSTFFQNEGMGPLKVAEPLVGWMVGALEGAVIGGGLIAVLACLYSLSSRKNGIVKCETALKPDDHREGPRQG